MHTYKYLMVIPYSNILHMHPHSFACLWTICDLYIHFVAFQEEWKTYSAEESFDKNSQLLIFNDYVGAVGLPEQYINMNAQIMHTLYCYK